MHLRAQILLRIEWYKMLKIYNQRVHWGISKYSGIEYSRRVYVFLEDILFISQGWSERIVLIKPKL
jgi:hypothetical protein